MNSAISIDSKYTLPEENRKLKRRKKEISPSEEKTKKLTTRIFFYPQHIFDQDMKRVYSGEMQSSDLVKKYSLQFSKEMIFQKALVSKSIKDMEALDLKFLPTLIAECGSTSQKLPDDLTNNLLINGTSICTIRIDGRVSRLINATFPLRTKRTNKFSEIADRITLIECSEKLSAGTNQDLMMRFKNAVISFNSVKKTDLDVNPSFHFYKPVTHHLRDIQLLEKEIADQKIASISSFAPTHQIDTPESLYDSPTIVTEEKSSFHFYKPVTEPLRDIQLLQKEIAGQKVAAISPLVPTHQIDTPESLYDSPTIVTEEKSSFRFNKPVAHPLDIQLLQKKIADKKVSAISSPAPTRQIDTPETLYNSPTLMTETLRDIQLLQKKITDKKVAVISSIAPTRQIDTPEILYNSPTLVTETLRDIPLLEKEIADKKVAAVSSIPQTRQINTPKSCSSYDEESTLESLEDNISDFFYLSDDDLRIDFEAYEEEVTF